MSIVLQSSGGGSVTIQEPVTASNLTATLPAATGTVMVSGNMPAFSAYQSSAQSISINTWTKIQFQTEEFDTANAYDNATNYRFTPQVAGYYQVTLGVYSSSFNLVATSIYKNAAAFKFGTQFNSSAFPIGSTTSALVFFNGTTDYIEGYVYLSSTANLIATATQTYLQATMVRSA